VIVAFGVDGMLPRYTERFWVSNPLDPGRMVSGPVALPLGGGTTPTGATTAVNCGVGGFVPPGAGFGLVGAGRLIVLVSV
jgi:hypothetical protein